MGFNMMPGVDRRLALDALPSFAFGDLECAHLEIMDRRLGWGEVPARGYRVNDFTGYEIDLTVSEDVLFANMTKSCRRDIRKAGKNGVVVEEVRNACFAEEYYHQLEDVFAKRDLVPTYSVERVHQLISHLMPTGDLLTVRARGSDGESIATGIFPAFNDTMFFWGGASWRSQQHYLPNEAIQWYAMRYWKQRGIARYDMGGRYDRGRAGEYKRKYGGTEISVPFLRTSRYPFLEEGRKVAKTLVEGRQRLAGRLRSTHRC